MTYHQALRQFTDDDLIEDDEACADAAGQADIASIALAAFYADADAAHRHLIVLMRGDVPMHRVSVLGRADAGGNRPLGVYYSGVGERMRGWGGSGAFWGGIFGLLGGAAGLFVLPGIGPVMAAGPLVATLTNAAVGTEAGTGAGGALTAGAAQWLAAAIHRLGIPAFWVDGMRRRLADGETVVLLLMAPQEAARWRPLLWCPLLNRAPAGGTESHVQPTAVWELPFTGVADVVRGRP
ncbi:MAG: hypothetical protein LJE69_11580 [Thiohalocapsa sp.]|jgi:hypothetical protein|uniref:hypothetical protein n=1 Tax=Thiohalocapsa sp. TaxID=2497641 RepID=UPI0025D00669|nr:hypothetical protein [Thiohalocapsa sp.]MCG6941876.1 hypothetical protein [Thiohalocapsa sp.]